MSQYPRREQKEKQEAKEKYWKVTRYVGSVFYQNLTIIQLHMAGKTDQAKTDLARLAKIKADREAAQAKRTAEAECKCSTILVYCDQSI